MPKLSFAQSIRYLFPGIVMYLYLWFWDHDSVASVTLNFEGIGILLFLLVGSIVLYACYRRFIYNSLITRIHDLLRPRRHNYRTYLKGKYPDLNHGEIIELFIDLRDQFLSERYKTLEIEASMIHLFYIAGLLGLGFLIYAFGIGSTTSPNMIYGTAALLLNIVAFLMDKDYENKEFKFVYGLSDDKIGDAYNRVTARKRA